MMEKTLYLKCAPGDVGDLVLLTGDPGRVERAARQLSDVQTIAQNREFITMTGTYKGQKVSVVSSGIGAPSAAIAIEELAQLGARAIVRFGTMMGISAKLGSYMIASGAVRYEGTSEHYLPCEYPAVPHWSLMQALYQKSRERGLETHVGVTATYDAFYPKMAPALVGRGLPDMEQLQQGQVIAVDMETALLFVAGARLRVATAAMCLVTNEADPFAIIAPEAHAAGETRLVTTVLDALVDWSSTDAG